MLAIINVGSDAAEADAMPRPPTSNESSSMRDRPWVDSDTWYALSAAAETSHLFFNARTGTVREGSAHRLARLKLGGLPPQVSEWPDKRAETA